MFVLPALLTLSVGGLFQAESPRLRTLLPNGATLLVERMPGAKALSVQLFAGVKGVREARATHGLRHLLEHLILKGQDGQLDDRLESAGVFFVGRTFREAMQVEFMSPHDRLDQVLVGVGEVLQPLKTTPELISREAGIMRHELAALGDPARLSRAIWEASFGDAALDPLGDPSVIAGATPDTLEQLRANHFSPHNLVLVICGNVSLKETTAKARKIFEELEGPVVTAQPPLKGQPGRAQTEDGYGESRAAIVGGLAEAGAAFCAAYGIATQTDNTYVTYTLSTGSSLVCVGRTDANNLLGTFIDGLTEGDEAAMFPVGKLLAERWLTTTLSTPSGSAYLRGLVMVQSAAARPEDLLTSIRSTGWSQFRGAIAKFRKDKAAIAVGVRE